MPAGPAAAFGLIGKYVPIDGAPRHVRSLLLTIIKGELWYFGDDAEEKADQWSENFKKRIINHFNDPWTLGPVQTIAINSASTDYVQGSCFCEPTDDSATVHAKRNRRNTLQIADFLKGISPNDLETLCRKMLLLLGVKAPEASRRSADGGVDFYGSADFGTILKPEILPAGVEKQLKVWFVGQAKHYPGGNVSTAEIRELIGSSDLARAKIFVGKNDPLHSLQARLCDPIFSLLVTTGRFSRDSIELLGRCGVIAMDGLQLAQLLADHEVGLVGHVFDEPALLTWMAA